MSSPPLTSITTAAASTMTATAAATTTTASAAAMTPAAIVTPRATKLQLQAAQAKARFDAVMQMQGCGENAAVANRIGTGRRPSLGGGPGAIVGPGPGAGSGVANSVSHPPRRPSTGGLLKRINSQPAY